MSKEMLVNTVAGQECRIAVVEDGVLEELYIERSSSASRVGNIYKGRVTNVEPGIQAAFVDFGVGKNGFLHISDVNPQYFPRGQKGGQAEAVGKKRPHRDRPPIQECLRRGQEVVVQMTKEGIGTKGPTLTTYLSIPGRMLVMMPGMSRLGVSRKIHDEQARQQARTVLQDLQLPPDMGFILRTAGLDRSKRDLQRDLHYLTRLWKSINHQIKSAKPPVEIYKESDLVIRTLRDVYNAEIERIICDSPDVARRIKDFLDLSMPRSKHVIEIYSGQQGLFHDLGLEQEIEKVFARRVELKSGGWLAFDQAEALVAIDVNSGRFREHTDAETTALKINMEAAGEIARQLRLRDLGGVVIIDFIDMREEKNRRSVERTLREAVKKDRAKTKVLKISAFGIVEMTRQRVRPSLRDSIYRRCVYCEGAGLVKSEESQALGVMRNIQRAVCHADINQIEVSVTPQVAHHLTNVQRRDVAHLEEESGKKIVIKADSTCRGEEVRITCTNSRGSIVAWDQPLAPVGKRVLKTVGFAKTAGEEEEPQELASAGVEALISAPEEEGEPAAVAEKAEVVAPPAGEVEGKVVEVQPAPEPTAAPTPPAVPATGAPSEAKPGRRRRGRRGGQRHRRGKGQQAQQAQGAAPATGEPPAALAEVEQPSGQAAGAERAEFIPTPPADFIRRTSQAAPEAPVDVSVGARQDRPAVPEAPQAGPETSDEEAKAAKERRQSPGRHAQGERPQGGQAQEAGAAAPEGKRRRRRGRRGGRRHRRKGPQAQGQQQGGQSPDSGEQGGSSAPDDQPPSIE